MPMRRWIARLVAAVALLVVVNAVAAAQAPGFPSQPRSNGGRAAGFGTMSGRGPVRGGGGQPSAIGAINSPSGASPRGGSSRPSAGIAGPAGPAMGGGRTGASGRSQARGAGMQVLSGEQLKAGAGQPGSVRRRSR